MGWDHKTVLRNAFKYPRSSGYADHNFPLVRIATKRFPGYIFITSTTRIDEWLEVRQKPVPGQELRLWKYRPRERMPGTLPPHQNAPRNRPHMQQKGGDATRRRAEDEDNYYNDSQYDENYIAPDAPTAPKPKFIDAGNSTGTDYTGNPEVDDTEDY